LKKEDRILAAGDSLEEVMDEVKRQGLDPSQVV
jgi:hypothetical protein